MSLRTKIKNQNNINIDTELDIISSKLGIEKQDIDFNNFDNIELAFEGLFTDIGGGLKTAINGIIDGIAIILDKIIEYITNFFNPNLRKVSNDTNNVLDKIYKENKEKIDEHIKSIVDECLDQRLNSAKKTKSKASKEEIRYLNLILKNLVKLYICNECLKHNHLNSVKSLQSRNYNTVEFTPILKIMKKVFKLYEEKLTNSNIKFRNDYHLSETNDEVLDIVDKVRSEMNNPNTYGKLEKAVELTFLKSLKDSKGLKELARELGDVGNFGKMIDASTKNLNKELIELKKKGPDNLTEEDKSKIQDIKNRAKIINFNAYVSKICLKIAKDYCGFVKSMDKRLNENNEIVMEMFCNYDNNIYQELATESFGEKVSLAYKFILDLIQKIYAYIKNWHPIKRKLINQQLELLKQLDYRTYGNDTFKKLNQGLNLSFSGLMFLCDYNFSNLTLLESAMFDVYYKLGSNPNPETLRDNIFIKFNINQKLNNFINFKAREFCKDQDMMYNRHSLATVYAKANVIYLYTMVYGTNNEVKLAKFKYEVKDQEKEEIDFKKLNNKKLATDLLYSHLDSLNKFRWVTESLNKNLKKNIHNYEPGAIAELSKSILEMVNCLNPKFYLIAMEYSKAMTKNIK